MKSIIKLMVVFVCVVSLVACGKKDTTVSANKDGVLYEAGVGVSFYYPSDFKLSEGNPNDGVTRFTKENQILFYKVEENEYDNDTDQLSELYHIKIARTYNGKLIYPKTLGQKSYYYALKNNDVVFGIGPAGTGKTYLAVVFAVAALKNNEVKKIILTRPAVEAGENLGFLPGDLKEKVDPYLRPLYDALYDMLGVEQTEKLMEKGVIEIAPLAYMRGRTLEDAYVILDEAQNTTDNQMKMFLTRLGFRSKMIITGDISQIDLPRNTTSGLIRALDILEGVKGISFIHLSAMDVVRHPVVQRIIERYDGNNE